MSTLMLTDFKVILKFLCKSILRVSDFIACSILLNIGVDNQRKR